MTTELTEIKSRYDGECAKCHRPLKVGWNIVYDKENKKVYCKRCGAPMMSVNGKNNSYTPALDVAAELDILRNFLTPEQLVEAEERLLKVANPPDPEQDFRDALIGEIRLLNAEISLLVAEMTNGLAGLHTAIGIIGNTMMDNPKEKAKKEDK